MFSGVIGGCAGGTTGVIDALERAAQIVWLEQGREHTDIAITAHYDRRQRGAGGSARINVYAS